MMFRLKSIALVLVVFLVIELNGQNVENDNLIYWSKDTKITWSDFKGIPPNSFKTQYNTEAKAASAVKLKYDMLLNIDRVEFNVYCCFNKNESWTKDTNSIKGLEHEKLHFDIGELYVRKMRKEFDSLRNNEIFERIIYDNKFDSLLQLCNDYNELYDKETMHGVVDKAQAEWEKSIQKELKEYETYYRNTYKKAP